MDGNVNPESNFRSFSIGTANQLQINCKIQYTTLTWKQKINSYRQLFAHVQ